ncbi:uncharacterized protein LOC106868221 [Octopus bimaculoides]|uniref:uncharacterized protein LOC106868221 n=1 Tax=Octopus bimaculoides TaxID=37653 RepID=UPI00071D2397|nr:uncharacterized protein LOC106868221 [Octopus bimaculoides]|eukprot:XP_014768872.1 PREDICTED: uncharacterized protein LOC106868221 [Octopus bimaculoides]
MTVQKWAAEFRRGNGSSEDDSRSGCSTTVITMENFDRVHHMVMDDRRLDINEITNAISIFRERVENIQYNELGMTKVSAQWAPYLLAPDQKHIKLIASRENLKQKDSALALLRDITFILCSFKVFRSFFS